MPRRAAFVLLLAAPFVLTSVGYIRLLEGASGLGAELRRIVQPWVMPRPQEPVAFVTADDRPIEEPSAAPSVRAAPTVAAKRGHPKGARSSEPLGAPTNGLFVHAGRVLELARAGVVPRGVPVPAGDGRPAGILLTDVERLGVGLRNGDVLTSALGAPARAEEDVVTAVLSARKQRAAHVSGRFWRAGEEWALVVQMPYVERESGSPTRPRDAPRAID